MQKWLGMMMTAALAAGAGADDWYTWRGPNGNGTSDETGLHPKGASVVWKKELGVGYSSVSIKDGRLYTMGNREGTDYVYCLDEKTGTEIWTASYPCEPGQHKGPRATPVVDGEDLYTVSREGELICFNAATGDRKWSTDVLKETGNENLRWGISSSAIIEGDLILLNIGESGTAVDKKTGRIEWKSKGEQSYASPVVFDHQGKRLAAVFSAQGLQIADVETGRKIDDYEWKTRYDVNGADPLVIGDKIFISSGYNRGCTLLDFSSGKLKPVWESGIMKNQFSSSVYLDGYLYGVDGQTKRKGFLRCLDIEDGSEQWSMPIGFGSLIAADGMLIALGERGTLYFAEATPEEYREIARFETGLSPLCWTPPVLANGRVYCRNDEGTLVAVDVGK